MPHPGGSEAWYEAVAAAGFHGVVGGDPTRCRAHHLVPSAGGRINRPEEVDGFAAACADVGHAFATIHVGWGWEDDAEMDRLADAVIAASDRRGCPMLVETHRATMTQDMYRTVALVGRHQDLRFTADLSHWYTGQEMHYGGRPMGPLLDRIAPVLARVRAVHGRIGTGGCIQVPVDAQRDVHEVWFGHWREIWTRLFATIKANAPANTVISFAPELLPPMRGYARDILGADGIRHEESERWQQTLVLRDVAQAWWEQT